MKQLKVIGILVVLLNSCATLEQRCAERFPQQATEVVKERNITDTIITGWHTIEYLDTTLCPPSADTVYKIKQVTKVIPGDTLINEYTCIDTILINTDQPKINYLKEKIKEQSLKIKTRGKLWWVILALALLDVAFLIYWIYRLRG